MFLARSTERVLSFIILLVAPGPSVQVFSYDEPLDYWLQVSVNVLSSNINGVVWVKLKAGEGLTLQTGGLRILKVRLGGRSLAIQPEQGSMRLRTTRHSVLKITYKGVFRSSKQTGGPERAQYQGRTNEQGYPSPVHGTKGLTSSVDTGSHRFWLRASRRFPRQMQSGKR